MVDIGFGTILVIGVLLWLAFWFTFHSAKALRRRRAKRLARELGLEVSAAEKRVRRGGEVEALVTVTSTGELEGVEVGLVCTESYDESNTDSEGRSYRSTNHATEFETWTPVESLVGSQSVRLAIPAEAPFSYRGNCLSFEWEVAARGRLPRGVDAEARSELSVLP
jgi:hypothetical protein